VLLRCLRREWDELRSGDHAAWGTAVFFFETDAQLMALRQVEVYASGPRLCYDHTWPEDEHGFLSDGRVFPDDEWPELFEITPRQFEAEWSKRSHRVAPAGRASSHLPTHSGPGNLSR
jgi:hypothetical protein